MKTSQVIITPSQQLIDAFINNSYDLKEILEKELNNNDSKIVELVQEYQVDRYQVYNCNDITINEIKDTYGSFNVTYDAYEYNGCKDMGGQKDDDMFIEFDLDLEKFELVLTGPEQYEKLSPSEKFI